MAKFSKCWIVILRNANATQVYVNAESYGMVDDGTFRFYSKPSKGGDVIIQFEAGSFAAFYPITTDKYDNEQTGTKYKV